MAFVPSPDDRVTRLSAIVPAADGRDTLDRCVAAIAAAIESPDEVIVVDRPAGASAAVARNVGALQAIGDVLVFVDADVLVHRDAIVRIRRAFESQPNLTAVFGSYDDVPEAAGTVSRFRNLLHHHVHQGSAGRAQTFWAGLGAIRRDAFVRAGGFDATERIEDLELGMRLTERGARIELDPGLLGTHLKSWSLWSMLRTDVTTRGASWVALMLRTRRAPATLNLAWRHRVSAAAWLLAPAALAARRPAAAATAVGVSTVLNRSFYALLLRQHGPGQAALGVALHGAHHLAAAAAVPVGAFSYLRARRRPRAARPRGTAPFGHEPPREARANRRQPAAA